jgi:hypothetical protein
MSKTLIVAVGIAYAYIAAESFWKGNAPMGIVYGGYALANCGLWAMAS